MTLTRQAWLVLKRCAWECKDLMRRVPDAWAVLVGRKGVESEHWFINRK